MSLAKSASTKPTTTPTFDSDLLKMRPTDFIPFKYLKIHFIVDQCSFPGLSINIFTMLIAYARLGLVQIIAYIPIAFS